ncbi:hypothetical protein B0H11DRAFT_2310351 [Mycena galericulata]|nr:hypothetical protein B0H11DRAFT_2310351 [Mycena galericulata]
MHAFVGHLRIVIKTDAPSLGHPNGAMAICCAAVERALQLCKSGSPSTEGVPRAGRKKTALSFVPWAEHAASYLKPIKTMSTQKWQEVFMLASALLEKSDSADDILQSSDADSCEGYTDPRSCVVVSDDEPEEEGDEEL